MMNNKRIIMDVDEVLRDMVTNVLKTYNSKKYHDDVKFEDLYHYNLSYKMPMIKNNEEFFRDNAEYVFLLSKPFKGASEVTNSLVNKGYDLVIASSQFKGLEDLTCKWLKEYDIGYSSLVFTRDKHLLMGDVLLDDAIHNVDVFNGLGVIMDKPWNKSWNGYRVNDLYEFEKLIDDKE